MGKGEGRIGVQTIDLKKKKGTPLQFLDLYFKNFKISQYQQCCTLDYVYKRDVILDMQYPVFRPTVYAC